MKLKKKNKSDLTFFLGCGAAAKGVGTILGMGALTLQNMKTAGPIGSSVDEKNLVDGTTSIYFVTEDSVTQVIKELTQLRKDMKKIPRKLEIIVDATDHHPVRNPNNGRKTPRPRAKR